MRSPLSDGLAEAGTTFTERPDGRVAVENLPGVRRTGSATFLQDEFADYEAQRKAAAPDTAREDPPADT